MQLVDFYKKMMRVLHLYINQMYNTQRQKYESDVF